MSVHKIVRCDGCRAEIAQGLCWIGLRKEEMHPPFRVFSDSPPYPTARLASLDFCGAACLARWADEFVQGAQREEE